MKPALQVPVTAERPFVAQYEPAVHLRQCVAFWPIVFGLNVPAAH
jgi:hypothetical protein